MGIPRLTQDLLPYTERAQLGAHSSQKPRQVDDVDKWVIDGPSLVYHVYNKLFAHTASTIVTAKAAPPKYTEINRGISTLLLDIENHGIEIKFLYFDGHLPISKREIRLDRLEKTRKQLEDFRLMHVELPVMASGLHTEALNSTLWQQGPVKSHRALLPPPPFLVASAIESLKVSKWADRVQVVPREADVACARIAACDTVSILSNDSDLALFPMKPETRTIWLSTLEKKFNHKNKGSQLQASVLQPAVVAKRFRIASLLLLGFERHLDTSITSAIVIDRARDHSRLASPREEYIAFASQYCLDQQPEQSLDLGGLDPRTAEYIVQANTSTEPPQVYFPVLHEDPSRDASWSYGAGIRQLSYSILASTASNSSRQREITEHYRKGPRISTTSVQLLGASEITSAINTLLELLAPVHAISLAKTVGSWHSLALHLLTREKLSRSRPIFLPSIHKLLGINMSRPIRPTWDDMHLNANVHAVLYSLRMLKQILVHTRVHQRSSPRIGPELNRLFEALYHMPTIEELFIDVLQLRLIMAAVGADTIRFMLRPIEGILGVRDIRKQQRGNKEAHGKKRPRLETVRKVGVKIKSTNAFDILAASSDEADAD